jgi:hypothetical protein
MPVPETLASCQTHLGLARGIEHSIFPFIKSSTKKKKSHLGLARVIEHLVPAKLSPEGAATDLEITSSLRPHTLVT